VPTPSFCGTHRPELVSAVLFTSKPGESRLATIKPLLGVMFVLGALLPAAPEAAIVGGQPDGNGHRYVGFLDASPIGRPDGPTGLLISPTVLLTAGHAAKALPPRA